MIGIMKKLVIQFFLVHLLYHQMLRFKKSHDLIYSLYFNVPGGHNIFR